jgi:hypothetical protein
MLHAFRIVACAALALLVVSNSTAAKTTEDPKQILQLIDKMLASPEATTGQNLARVVTFARDSDVVVVQPRPEFCHVGKGPADQMLLGFYIAGAVKFDLEHPSQAEDPYADKVTAMRASLVAYRAILKRKPDFKNALMEKLARLERESKLEAYVESVAEKDRAKKREQP